MDKPRLKTHPPTISDGKGETPGVPDYRARPRSIIRPMKKFPKVTSYGEKTKRRAFSVDETGRIVILAIRCGKKHPFINIGANMPT